jgi:hypothetical protein
MNLRKGRGPAGFLAFALLTTPLWANAPASIGVATTIGSVSVNQTVVSGSADLVDGARLETASVPTDVRLNTGAEVRLATRSSGSFFADHVQLEQGALRVADFSGVTVAAAQLQINSDDAATQVIVRLTKKTVEVASVGGAVNVMDSGILTRVAAGTKMSFEQTGATPANQSPTPTGAAAAPKSRMPGDEKTLLWAIGITAVAALAIGLTAAAEGKSPFR